MFKIDIGHEPPRAASDVADPGQVIRFHTFARADRAMRQCIAEMHTCETVEELSRFLEAEDLLIDALHLFDPAMAHAIAEAEAEIRACLTAGSDPRPAEPGTSQDAQQPTSASSAMKGNTMFNFDAGAGGSEGPWLAWSARGTQDGTVPPRSFYIRDEAGKTPFDISAGIVLDIWNMKTGWQKSEGIAGKAPEWVWNPTISQMVPQPGDDYKKGIQIRVALGGGKAATWEQAGAAAWNAFASLVPAIQAGPGDQSMLPLVRMTGAKVEQYARGGTVIPQMEIVKWVPRPDCLKADFQPPAQPAPAQPQAAAPVAPAAPAQPAAPAAEVPADVAF